MTPSFSTRAAALGYRGAKIVFLPLFAVAWFLLSAWSSLAIAYAPGGPAWPYTAGAIALFAMCAWLAFFQRRRWLRFAGPIGLWALVIAWFLWVPASNDRPWEPEFRVAPRITIAGDTMTVQGVRNFAYRGTTDFEERWEDRTYDLAHLKSLDLFMSYWGPTLICHTFVSFGFEKPDGSSDYLCVSIETRRKAGQVYSAIGGAFRQFTLIFVVADERDVVYVRSNIRREEVFRYRIVADPRLVRELLDAYVARANLLATHPAWYNAITQSCGVDILRIIYGGKMPLIPPLRALTNGLWDQLAYDNGRLGDGEPFGALRAEARINDLAIGDPPLKAPLVDFSQRIRGREVLMRPRVMELLDERTR